MENKSFHHYLKDVVEKLGPQILSTNVVVNCLADYGVFKTDPYIKHFLKSAVAEGHLVHLLKMDEVGNTDVIDLEGFVFKLHEKYGYDIRLVRYFYRSIAYALGWIPYIVNSARPILTGYDCVDCQTINGNGLTIHRVLVNENETILEMSESNYISRTSWWTWITINPEAHLIVDGKKFRLIYAEDIELSPKHTYFSYAFQRLYFKLHFEPIPITTRTFDFIEDETSSWNRYGVNLDEGYTYLTCNVTNSVNTKE